MYKGLLGIALAAGFVAVALGTAATASAQTYPWCAEYGNGRNGGGTNCGFVTLAQCQATVFGVGGYCQQNPLYSAAVEKPGKRHRHHQS
jgi:hypothetical protein